jgi:hypothetical protein
MIAYTVMYGRSDLTGGQLNLLRRYCPEVTEVRVAINGPDYDPQEQECKRLGLSFLRSCAPPGAVTAESHGHALNLLWQAWAVWEDEDALILDHDMFPFRPTSPMAWLKDNPVAGHVFTGPPAHPWGGLLAIRRDAPGREFYRFGPVHVHRHHLNPGGMIYAHLAKHGAAMYDLEKVRIPGKLWEVLDGSWLHHRDASNWGGRDGDAENRRTGQLYRFIGRALAGEGADPWS